MEKSPVKYPLVRYLSFCDPALILRNKKISISRLTKALGVFVECNRISGLDAEKVERDFKQLIENPKFEKAAQNFSRKTDRLDHFWMKSIDQYDYSQHLAKILQMIFVLYHSNATPERGFSINKQCLFDNQKEKSLVAIRHVWHAVHDCGGIENIQISKSMIHAVRNSRSL